MRLPSPLSPTWLWAGFSWQDTFLASISGKRKFEGCSRTLLGVPFDCPGGQQTPERYFCIYVYLDISPKDGRVISDQQQEMEANVLTPKTFYSFCLVLHLPPRAAAFISPFE